MKQFVIDGLRFCDMEGFYDHVGTILCPGFAWGRNLDALNDILRGGFGAFEYGESIQIEWLSSEKSRNDLGFNKTLWWPGAGQTQFEIIIGLIKENGHELSLC